MIYLDNAATSWPKPEAVYQAVDYCLRQLAANPGRGGYTMARQAALLYTRQGKNLLSCLDLMTQPGFVLPPMILKQ